MIQMPLVHNKISNQIIMCTFNEMMKTTLRPDPITIIRAPAKRESCQSFGVTRFAKPEIENKLFIAKG